MKNGGKEGEEIIRNGRGREKNDGKSWEGDEKS